MPHFDSSPDFICLALPDVSSDCFQRCSASLGDTVLDGFAVLGVDHGLIFVG
jgi:hypothetical protein